MADLLKNASELIQSEGFTGAHSLIFLIRYAFLAEKKSLMKLIGNTLEGLSGLEESASLVYAYAEYYKAEKAEFCLPALSFLIPRCRDDDPMLLPALAKAANVTGDERFLQLAPGLTVQRGWGSTSKKISASFLIPLLPMTCSSPLPTAPRLCCMMSCRGLRVISGGTLPARCRTV